MSRTHTSGLSPAAARTAREKQAKILAAKTAMANTALNDIAEQLGVYKETCGDDGNESLRVERSEDDQTLSFFYQRSTPEPGPDKVQTISSYRLDITCNARTGKYTVQEYCLAEGFSNFYDYSGGLERMPVAKLMLADEEWPSVGTQQDYEFNGLSALIAATISQYHIDKENIEYNAYEHKAARRRRVFAVAAMAVIAGAGCLWKASAQKESSMPTPPENTSMAQASLTPSAP